MDSMILGRYVSGNSIIHRLDPRSKLLSMFFFILIIFKLNFLCFLVFSKKSYEIMEFFYDFF